MLTWLLLKDGLAVRGKLQRLGLVLEESNVCPFCREDKEESHNLFVHFGDIYNFGQDCLICGV